MVDRQEHPVLAGLLALVGVGLVVGMVLGFGALAATQVLGLDGGSESTDTTARQSMYLPRPLKTKAPTGPLITLGGGASESPSAEPSKKPGKSKTKEPRTQISLSAGQTAVGAMEQIDLTGTYPRGEGSVLRVERFDAGKWDDFAQITVLVSNETFSTYVQTSQPGVNRFRVVDTDTGASSNVVRVRIG
ncbi:MAG: hypothetical protein ABWY33_07165 [Cellulomonas sp.]